MANWDEYFNATTSSEETETVSTLPDKTPSTLIKEEITQEDIAGSDEIELSREYIAGFTKRLSGRINNDIPKSVISYSCYALEDENSVDKESVYTLPAQVEAELSANALLPGFYCLDIKFKSADDISLKLLWSRLQKHKRHEAEEGVKTWIFYINLMESMAALDEENVTPILTANILNPTLFYLTREIPSYLCEDFIINDDERIGGNIVRMLIHESLVSFELSADVVDMKEIKQNVLRDIDSNAYIEIEAAKRSN